MLLNVSVKLYSRQHVLRKKWFVLPTSPQWSAHDHALRGLRQHTKRHKRRHSLCHHGAFCGAYVQAISKPQLPQSSSVLGDTIRATLYSCRLLSILPVEKCSSVDVNVFQIRCGRCSTTGFRCSTTGSLGHRSRNRVRVGGRSTRSVPRCHVWITDR